MHLSPSRLKPLSQHLLLRLDRRGEELEELHLLSSMPLDDPARQKIEIGERVWIVSARTGGQGHRSSPESPWKFEICSSGGLS